MKIDFNIDRGKKENTEEIINTVEPELVVNKPVRSIATVRFENIKEYILDKNWYLSVTIFSIYIFYYLLKTNNNSNYYSSIVNTDCSFNNLIRSIYKNIKIIDIMLFLIHLNFALYSLEIFDITKKIFLLIKLIFQLPIT